MQHIVGSNSGSKLSRTAVIAIVDDDYSVREALTALVSSLGYIAMAFECADDLLKANRRRVACAIADVQMPGMTGLELYERLVASGEPIPTILITAFPDERARLHALQAGVNWYLPNRSVRTSCSRAFARFWERREVGGHGS